MGLFDFLSKLTDEQYFDEGNNLIKINQYSEAVASFDKALAISPNDVTTWFNRGITLGELYRYSDALDSFENTLSDQDSVHAIG